MAAAKDTVKDAVKETNETKQPDMVTVSLPLTKERQEDVFVAINGVSYLIKRGEEVTIPRNVYEVLRNSERMDTLALQRSKALAGKAKS
jgi:uncharacterized protein YfaA (DUF2138 family)